MSRFKIGNCKSVLAILVLVRVSNVGNVNVTGSYLSLFRIGNVLVSLMRRFTLFSVNGLSLQVPIPRGKANLVTKGPLMTCRR